MNLLLLLFYVYDVLREEYAKKVNNLWEQLEDFSPKQLVEGKQQVTQNE